MHVHEEQVQGFNETAGRIDGSISLLAEVDFKWLMAGQGWWIDTRRFHADPVYASSFLRLAMGSPSFALRDCAALLLAQIDAAATTGKARQGDPTSDQAHRFIRPSV